MQEGDSQSQRTAHAAASNKGSRASLVAAFVVPILALGLVLPVFGLLWGVELSYENEFRRNVLDVNSDLVVFANLCSRSSRSNLTARCGRHPRA